MRLAVAALLLAGLTACGHGLSGGYVPPPTGANVAPIIVDGGPPSIAIGNINLPFVSVTVCLPATTTCQLVDHVLLDTASTGLRIIAAVLPAGFNLPQAADTGGAPLWECLPFVDGYSWGSVRTADVKIANGAASSQSIHLIGDPAIATVPQDCIDNSLNKLPINTVDSFGANGVLGLSVFQHDCGAICADPANIIAAAYYGCPTGSSCVNSAATLGTQVQNPVYNFATDNNGVTIVMAAIGASGQVTATGSLILGINTQPNNMLGSAAVLTVDSLGYFTTKYGALTLPDSFIDSGSNALFFNDSTLTACATITGFYCPAQLLTALQASNQSAGGPISTVSFKVDNLETLSTANSSFNALPNIAGSNPLTLSFDWGLPFFYGRTVFVGFENRSAAQSTGPFFAY